MFPQLWKTCCVSAIVEGDEAAWKHEGDYTGFLAQPGIFQDEQWVISGAGRTASPLSTHGFPFYPLSALRGEKRFTPDHAFSHSFTPRLDFRLEYCVIQFLYEDPRLLFC
jgi:hypothetical protein